MNYFKRKLHYFTKFELGLWFFSVSIIIASFFIPGKNNYLSLIASLIGATALIFNAKGNPAGQAMMIVFGILYSIISYSQAYYGEMITYAGMSVPMAAFSLISWLKHPFNGNKSEVKINRIQPKELIILSALTISVTVGFFFILKAFNTANLIISTVSVATSFIAVYFSFRRSPFYALGYTLNDLVLIVLWIVTSINDPSYISVVICFCVFLFNDFYAFICWCKRAKSQKNVEQNDTDKSVNETLSDRS